MSRSRRARPIPPPVPPPPPAPSRFPRWGWLAGGLLLLIGIVGIGVLALGAEPRAAVLARSPVLPDPCASELPPFVRSLGGNEAIQIDTRDTTRTGLVLRSGEQVWQQPSWDDLDDLGPFVLGPDQAIYVAPAPKVRPLAPERLTQIGRVDPSSGVLTVWASVPATAPITVTMNPHGIVGLAVSCATRSLYATSVAGSTRETMHGRIVRIDLASGQITSAIDGFDALGVVALGDRLLVGHARQPEVWAVALAPDGNLVGDPVRQFALTNLPDATARARRLTLAPDGRLFITVTPFAYSLEVRIGADERRVLRWNATTLAWQEFR